MGLPDGLWLEDASGRLTDRATNQADFGQQAVFAQVIGDAIDKQTVETLLVDLRDTGEPDDISKRYPPGELAAHYLPKISRPRADA